MKYKAVYKEGNNWDYPYTWTCADGDIFSGFILEVLDYLKQLIGESCIAKNDTLILYKNEKPFFSFTFCFDIGNPDIYIFEALDEAGDFYFTLFGYLIMFSRRSKQ